MGCQVHCLTSSIDTETSIRADEPYHGGVGHQKPLFEEHSTGRERKAVPIRVEATALTPEDRASHKQEPFENSWQSLSRLPQLKQIRRQNDRRRSQNQRPNPRSTLHISPQRSPTRAYHHASQRRKHDQPEYDFSIRSLDDVDAPAVSWSFVVYDSTFYSLAESWSPDASVEVQVVVAVA